jgi:hypothetical protein
MLHLLLQLLNTDISMQLFEQSILLEYHGVNLTSTPMACMVDIYSTRATDTVHMLQAAYRTHKQNTHALQQQFVGKIKVTTVAIQPAV